MNKTAAFFEFIYERQAVWHRRNVLRQAAPWSEDEILCNFRFCNVYRELDGGTLAIGKYLADPEISAEQKLFNIIAYRFFNRRDTIERLFGSLLDPQSFDWHHYEERWDQCKREENIFSNAYLVSSHPYRQGYRAKDKHIQILLMLDDLRPKLGKIIKDLNKASPQEGLAVIERAVALAGPFLSGQILLDATYAGNIVPYTSNDFLVVGPGAHWGLNIIFEKKLSKKEASERCRYLWKLQQSGFAGLKRETGKDWFAVKWDNPAYCGGDYLSLHDIQNSLCEFRKYWRLKSGEKAKRRYYNSDIEGKRFIQGR